MFTTDNVRFDNVYGSHSDYKNSGMAKLFKRAFSGLPLATYGNGEQTGDFIYIDDLTQAILPASASSLFNVKTQG